MVRKRGCLTFAAVFVLVVVTAVLMAPGSEAATEHDGLLFDRSTGQVVGYTEEPSGTLEIPRHIGGTSVVGIGEYAFMGCTGITGLVLPESIRSIGGHAFEGCTGLTGSVPIPNSLLTVGTAAFRGCIGIESVYFGMTPSLTAIGDGAFEGCTGMTGTPNLPSKLKLIGDGAFSGCVSLKGNLYLPNSLKTMGNMAFRDCAGLTGTVTLPDGLNDLGTLVFSGCPQVDGFSVHRDNRTYTSVDGVVYTKDLRELVSGTEGIVGVLDLPSKVTSVRDRSMENSGITGILFHEDSKLESIGTGAFRGCASMSGTLSLPGKLVKVGEDAFRDCSGLTGLVLDDGLEYIGRGSFSGTGLGGFLHIPDSVSSLVPGAFSDSGVEGFRVDPGNTHYRSDPQGILYSHDWKTLIMSGDQRKVSIPESVLTIGNLAFSGTCLREIDIPLNVRTISEDAFLNCSLLERVSLRSGIFLETSAFGGCTGLKDVSFLGYPSQVAPGAFDVEFYDGTTFGDDESRMYGDFHRDWANGSPLVKVLSVKFVSGSSETVERIMYGDTVERPEPPVRDGYRFEGWLLDGEKYDFGSPVTSDITLTASWSLIPVKTDDKEGEGALPVLALSIIMFGAVLGMFYMTARDR